MARNGAGVYSKINNFSSGATITASGHNDNWNDLATEMTNSVAADGQTTITGALKGAVGSAAAPSYSFSSDLDTGIYHDAANSFAGAVGGTKVLGVTASGVDAASGRVLQGGAALVPAGAIIPYGGSSAPTGWLLCDGSAVSRTTYADLFSAISTTYGTGDGTTTFNVPDLTGRVPAGKEATATRLTSGVGGVDGGTLGASGGVQAVTLAKSQIPTGLFTMTDPGHTHSYTAVTTGAPGGGGASVNNTTTGTTGSSTTGITLSDHAGGGAHGNVQPTLIVNYIIKT